MYSIHDKAAQAFITPFFMHNKAMAIRAFADNINSTEESNLSKHPEQFSLFQVGEFEDSIGKVTELDKPELIASGLEVLEPTQEEDLIKEIKSLKALLITKGE